MARALLAALLVAPRAFGAPADDLKKLRNQIDTLKRELLRSEESRSEAADALAESERAISGTNRRLFELAGQQRQARAELSRLDAQRRDLEQHVERQRGLLARQLYQRYLAGQPEPLQLLLDRRDPGDLARRMHYLGYVYRARGRAIETLRQDAARLQALAQQSEVRGRELSALQAEQTAQRERLEAEKRDRTEVLAKVSGEVLQQRRQIDRLKADEKRLERLVDRLAKALAAKKRAARAAKSGRSARTLRNEAVPELGDSGTFRQLKGRMRLPVTGELRNRFGKPRAEGGVSWKGLFIRAAPGEEVRAVAPGRVVFADWLRGFGNLLIVDHEGGYMSLYANNESLYRQIGDSVSTGEAIASVGSSGGSPESGLYFELRYLGKPFDPLGWVNLGK